MGLAGFALRNRMIVLVSVILLMLWGVQSYNTMPRREDPEYTVRTAQVLTSWPGTPTEKVEELVTSPLEEEINSLDGIRWVRSETTVGVSAIYVDLDRDTQRLLQCVGHERRRPFPKPDGLDQQFEP